LVIDNYSNESLLSPPSVFANNHTIRGKKRIQKTPKKMRCVFAIAIILHVVYAQLPPPTLPDVAVVHPALWAFTDICKERTLVTTDLPYANRPLSSFWTALSNCPDFNTSVRIELDPSPINALSINAAILADDYRIEGREADAARLTWKRLRALQPTSPRSPRVVFVRLEHDNQIVPALSRLPPIYQNITQWRWKPTGAFGPQGPALGVVLAATAQLQIPQISERNALSLTYLEFNKKPIDYPAAWAAVKQGQEWSTNTTAFTRRAIGQYTFSVLDPEFDTAKNYLQTMYSVHGVRKIAALAIGDLYNQGICAGAVGFARKHLPGVSIEFMEFSPATKSLDKGWFMEQLTSLHGRDVANKPELLLMCTRQTCDAQASWFYEGRFHFNAVWTVQCVDNEPFVAKHRPTKAMAYWMGSAAADADAPPSPIRQNDANTGFCDWLPTKTDPTTGHLVTSAQQLRDLYQQVATETGYFSGPRPFNDITLAKFAAMCMKELIWAQCPGCTGPELQQRWSFLSKPRSAMGPLSINPQTGMSDAGLRLVQQIDANGFRRVLDPVDIVYPAPTWEEREYPGGLFRHVFERSIHVLIMVLMSFLCITTLVLAHKYRIYATNASDNIAMYAGNIALPMGVLEALLGMLPWLVDNDETTCALRMWFPALPMFVSAFAMTSMANIYRKGQQQHKVTAIGAKVNEQYRKQAWGPILIRDCLVGAGLSFLLSILWMTDDSARLRPVLHRPDVDRPSTFYYDCETSEGNFPWPLMVMFVVLGLTTIWQRINLFVVRKLISGRQHFTAAFCNGWISRWVVIVIYILIHVSLNNSDPASLLAIRALLFAISVVVVNQEFISIAISRLFLAKGWVAGMELFGSRTLQSTSSPRAAGKDLKDMKSNTLVGSGSSSNHTKNGSGIGSSGNNSSIGIGSDGNNSHPLSNHNSRKYNQSVATSSSPVAAIDLSHDLKLEDPIASEREGKDLALRVLGDASGLDGLTLHPQTQQRTKENSLRFPMLGASTVLKPSNITTDAHELFCKRLQSTVQQLLKSHVPENAQWLDNHTEVLRTILEVCKRVGALKAKGEFLFEHNRIMLDLQDCYVELFGVKLSEENFAKQYEANAERDRSLIDKRLCSQYLLRVMPMLRELHTRFLRPNRSAWEVNVSGADKATFQGAMDTLEKELKYCETVAAVEVDDIGQDKLQKTVTKTIKMFHPIMREVFRLILTNIIIDKQVSDNLEAGAKFDIQSVCVCAMITNNVTTIHNNNNNNNSSATATAISS
jgi:hypothetical protein